MSVFPCYTYWPRLGGRTESSAAPGGKNPDYEGGQLKDFDQGDDGHADPEAQLSANVRDKTNDFVIGRLGSLNDVAVGDVNDDPS